MGTDSGTWGGTQVALAGKDDGKMAAALLPPGQVGELLGGQGGRAAPAVLGPMASPQDTLKLLTACSEYVHPSPSLYTLLTMGCTFFLVQNLQASSCGSGVTSDGRLCACA